MSLNSFQSPLNTIPNISELAALERHYIIPLNMGSLLVSSSISQIIIITQEQVTVQSLIFNLIITYFI